MYVGIYSLLGIYYISYNSMGQKYCYKVVYNIYILLKTTFIINYFYSILIFLKGLLELWWGASYPPYLHHFLYTNNDNDSDIQVRKGNL